METAQTIQSERESIAGGTTPVDLWLEKIRLREKAEKDWRGACELLVRKYEARKPEDRAINPFNILHANVEVEVPTLYNSPPVPDIRVRYPAEMPEIDEDAIIDQARSMAPEGAPPEQIEQQAQQVLAQQREEMEKGWRRETRQQKRIADILDRAATAVIDMCPFDSTIMAAVKHAVLLGRGVLRIRYDAVMDGEADQVADETVEPELVPWDRFIIGPGLSWRRVPWIGFRHDLTKVEVARQLKEYGRPDDEIAARVDAMPFGKAKKDDNVVTTEELWRGHLMTIPVYEIWDKDTRKVLFIAECDHERPLCVKDDPFGLKDFFPMARPIYRLDPVSSLVPIIPADVYDQLADELNEITVRIRRILKAVKARGIYDPALRSIIGEMELLEDGQYASSPAGDTTTLNSMFAANGVKISDMIHHFPLADLIASLKQLYEQRGIVLQTIYEVTGISDVRRGSTDSNETLGAQQLKAQFGSLRTSTAQQAVATFVRDTLRVMVEMIATMCQRETIERMCGMTINDETFGALRNTAMLMYIVDIETDSTIRGDVGRNQEQWGAFLNGMAQFTQATAQAGQVMPHIVPHLTKLFGAFVRKQRLGKEAEDVLDDMFEAAEKAAEAAVANQGNEAEQQQAQQAHEQQMQMMQADQQRAGEQHQMLADKHQMDMSLKQFDMQSRQQVASMDMAGRQAEQQRSGANHQMEMVQADKRMEVEGVKAQATVIKAQADIARAKMGIQGESLKIRSQEMQAAYDADAQARQMQFDQHKMGVDAQNMARKAQFDERSSNLKFRSASEMAKLKARNAAKKKGTS